MSMPSIPTPPSDKETVEISKTPEEEESETYDPYLGVPEDSSMSMSMSMPSATPETEEAAKEPGTEDCAGSILDVASGDGRFSTLVTAVLAADLADALSGDGELTLYAPTDEAFAALPASAVESFLRADNVYAADILKYHVVPGRVGEDAIYVETLGGQSLEVKGVVVVGNEVEACNGVIRPVDEVLLPDPSSFTVVTVDKADAGTVTEEEEEEEEETPADSAPG